MTTPLTPALALACLRELSTDIRAAVVLDAAGTPLAGDASLAARARELLDGVDAAIDPATGVRLRREDDAVLLAVRRDGALAIAVLAGEHALIPLLAHDLRALLDDQIPRHS
jgi:hypothetical protein